MKYLYQKELNYYLNNPIGYIIIILFAVVANFFFIRNIFADNVVSMRDFFNLIPWLFLVFIPALSMRSISEEKRTNTIETLLTLPISETEIVLAKFLALMTLTCIGLLLTLALPIWLLFVAKLYLPEVLIGYIGVLFLAGLFISLSMFFSSLTKNQVVALLISVIVIFFLIVLNSDFTASLFPKVVQDALSYFSPMYHLLNFAKGLIDLRSLFYFVSTTALFLFLTIIDLEKRG